MDVEARITDILVKSLHMEPDEITPEANLKTDLEMDSTELVELVIGLEQEFKVSLRDGELSNKQSVGDIEKIISDKLG